MNWHAGLFLQPSPPGPLLPDATGMPDWLVAGAIRDALQSALSVSKHDRACRKPKRVDVAERISLSIGINFSAGVLVQRGLKLLQTRVPRPLPHGISVVAELKRPTIALIGDMGAQE